MSISQSHIRQASSPGSLQAAAVETGEGAGQPDGFDRPTFPENLDDLDITRNDPTLPRQSKRPQKGTRLRHEAKVKISRGQRIGKNLIVLFLCGFILFGAIGYYKWHASRALQLVRDSLQQCKAAIAQDRFAEADRLCREVTQVSQSSFPLHNAALQSLQDKAYTILQSETMQQGLQGNILYKGRYLASSDAQLQQQFDELATKAASMFAAEKWQQAADGYAQLQDMARTAKLFSEQQQTELAQKFSTAQLRMYVQLGHTALDKRLYRNAQQAFAQAQQVLTHIAEEDRERFAAEIAHGLTAVQFEAHKADAEQFFSQADWRNAIDAYKQAVQTARKSAVDPAALSEIELKMNRALVYTMIEQGNNAFSNGNWHEAAAAFRQATKTLETKSDILNPADLENSINKLAKITLQTVLLQYRKTAAALIEKGNLTDAKKIYEEAIAAISNSSLAGDREFISGKKEFAGQIKDLERDILLQDKLGYLTNNYQKIFLINYPSAEKDNLVNPVVTLHKDTPDHLIFRMQCTERNSGSRPVALVMLYSFNKNTGQWQLYSEP